MKARQERNNELKIEFAELGMLVGLGQSEVKSFFDLVFTISEDSGLQKQYNEAQMGNLSSKLFEAAIGNDNKSKISDILNSISIETLPAVKNLLDNPSSVIDSQVTKALNVALILTASITFILMLKDSKKENRTKYISILAGCAVAASYLNLDAAILKNYFSYITNFFIGETSEGKEVASVFVEPHMASFDVDDIWASGPYIVAKTLILFFLGDSFISKGGIVKTFVKEILHDSNKSKSFGDFMKEFLKSVSKLLNKLSEKVFGKEFFSWYKDENVSLIKDFEEKYNKFWKKIDKDGLICDQENYEDVVEMLELSNRLIKEIPNTKETNGIKTTLVQNRNMLYKWREKLAGIEFASLGMRMEPVCILLSGPPGVGKSYLEGEIISYLAPRVLSRRDIKKFLGGSRSKYIFNREPNCKHWDTYDKNIVFTVYDDFKQAAEVPGSEVSQSLELIKTINGAPYVLNMADVVDKGKARFLSKFVLLNSNEEQFADDGMIKDMDALYRRIHFHVRVTFKEEYCTQASTKGRNPYAYKLRKEHISRDEQGRTFIDPSKMNFTLLKHTSKSKHKVSTVKNLTFDELCEKVYKKYLVHKEYFEVNQERLDARARKHYEMVTGESVDELLADSDDELDDKVPEIESSSDDESSIMEMENIEAQMDDFDDELDGMFGNDENPELLENNNIMGHFEAQYEALVSAFTPPNAATQKGNRVERAIGQIEDAEKESKQSDPVNPPNEQPGNFYIEYLDGGDSEYNSPDVWDFENAQPSEPRSIEYYRRYLKTKVYNPEDYISSNEIKELGNSVLNKASYVKAQRRGGIITQKFEARSYELFSVATRKIISEHDDLSEEDYDSIYSYLIDYYSNYSTEDLSHITSDRISSIHYMGYMILSKGHEIDVHEDALGFFDAHGTMIYFTPEERDAFAIIAHYFNEIVALVTKDQLYNEQLNMNRLKNTLVEYRDYFNNRVKVNLYITYSYVYCKYGPTLYFPAFVMQMMKDQKFFFLDAILRFHPNRLLQWLDEESLVDFGIIGHMQRDKDLSEDYLIDESGMFLKVVYKIKKTTIHAAKKYGYLLGKYYFKFIDWISTGLNPNGPYFHLWLFLRCYGLGIGFNLTMTLTTIGVKKLWEYLFKDSFVEGQSIDHDKAIRKKESGKPKLRPKLFGKEASKLEDTHPQMNPFGDKQGVAILDSIRTRNMWFMQVKKLNTKKEEYSDLGSVLFIRGTTCVMPLHFVYNLSRAVTSNKLSLENIVRFIKMNRDGKQFYKFVTIGEIIDGTRSMESMEDRDLCLVSLPHHFPVAQDILKYIPTAEEMHNTRELDCVIASAYGVPALTKMLCTKAELLTKETEVLDGKTNEYYSLATSFEYKAPTEKGDCGAILYIANKKLKHSKIFGMHVAGNSKTGKGYSVPLIREEIEQLLEIVPEEQKLQFDISMEFDGIESQSGKFGDVVNCIGKARKRPMNQTTTQLKPSKISGVLRSPKKRPAALKSFVNDKGEVISPWGKAISKYGKDEIHVPKEIISAAGDSLKVFLDNQMQNVNYKYIRKLTIREAIAGIDGWDAFNRIDLTTSNGYPDNTKGRNKRTIFGPEGLDFDTKEFHEFEKRINGHINDMLQGKRKFFAYFDNLKDELRENSKVDEGKTRLFSCVNFELFVLFRMYFGGFLGTFTDNAIDNSCAIGVNPYDTVQWNAIRKRLQKFTDHLNRCCGDGDFASFDGSQLSALQWELFNLITSFYDKVPHPDSDDRIRFILFHEITNSLHILLGELYEWLTGMPSGHPLTALINSLYNMLVIRIAYIYAHDGDIKSILHFDRHVWLMTLGDDLAYTVSCLKRHIFNPKALGKLLAKVGMTFTSADKGTPLSEDFKTIEETSFLKRTWQYNSLLKTYVAPLSMETIYELPNWVTGHEEDINLLDRCNHAAKELSLHGRAIFEKYVNRLHNTLVKEIGRGLDSTNYEVTLRSVTDSDNPYKYFF